jgi:hypothetical protein
MHAAMCVYMTSIMCLPDALKLVTVKHHVATIRACQDNPQDPRNTAFLAGREADWGNPMAQ